MEHKCYICQSPVQNHDTKDGIKTTIILCPNCMISVASAIENKREIFEYRQMTRNIAEMIAQWKPVDSEDDSQ